MPSERVQRQIERLLDEAEQALAAGDWAQVRARSQDALAFDPDNVDARDFLAAAQRRLGEQPDPHATLAIAREPTVVGATPSIVGAALAVAREPLPSAFAAGRYQVKSLLGEGGRKRVYLAHDSRLDRDVAIAVIKVEGLDAGGRERVGREAQAMARLGDHPNIVTVFDTGEEPREGPSNRQQGTRRRGSLSPGERVKPALSRAEGVRGSLAEGSQPYIVMECMAGGSLEDLLAAADAHRLPLPDAFRIGAQIASGLEYAHAKGVIHRDLKPGNVWLTEDRSQMTEARDSSLSPGERVRARPEVLDGVRGTPAAASQPPVVKIGDFGLAVALDRSRLTAEGMMLGTVTYMAPEQALGQAPAPRSDLYSLGCILYEMVTGRPPFVGEETVAIVTQHLNTPPVAPTWHRPDCPAGLEALVLRLLEKDASKRPETAAAVVAALAAAGGVGVQFIAPGRGVAVDAAVGAAGVPSAGGMNPAPTTPDNPLYRRTFVGRERELKELQSAFDAALSGQGSLAMVVGEPGIGKTALCEQLQTYVALRGGRVIAGHCYEEGSLSLPYLPFVEAMRSYVLAREPEGLRSDLGFGAQDVARIVSEVRDRLAVELRPPGDPEDDRWRLLQAVSGFLRAASSVQPLLIVLEDLHWADRGSLDLLLHVARNLEGARILIVGNYRDIEVDRAHPLSGALADLRRLNSFRSVRLRGLTIDEVQRMMSNIRGQDAALATAEAIHRQTEGNPLFVQEVLRYIVEEGLLVREGGRYVRTDDRPVEAIIPEGLRDVVGKRLSRLSAECNRLLAVAAVIGRDFDLATLRTLAVGGSAATPPQGAPTGRGAPTEGETHTVGAQFIAPRGGAGSGLGMDEEGVLGALEEAVRIGVLEERSRPGQVLYRFAHAFFRQTLYEEMIAPRRLRLHQEVARALEAQYGSRKEDHAAELAEHFAQSTDRADLAKAVEYGELAAQRAMAVFDYGEAVRLLERALDVQEVLDPEDKAKRCDLLLAVAGALMPSGEAKRVWEHVAEAAFGFAVSLGDSGRASQACEAAIVSNGRLARGLLTALPLFRVWAERANQYAAQGTRARVYANVALADLPNMQAEDAWALRENALTNARGLPDPETLAYAIFANVRYGGRPGDNARILSLAREASGLEGRGVSAFTFGGLLHAIVTVLWTNGYREEAEAQAQRLSELAARTQDAFVVLSTFDPQALFQVLDGKLEEAVLTGLAREERGHDLGADLFGLLPSPANQALIFLGRSAEVLAVSEQVLMRTEQGSMARRYALPAIRLHALVHLGMEEEIRLTLAAEQERRGSSAPPAWLIAQLAAAVELGDADLAVQVMSNLTAGAPLFAFRSTASILGSAAVMLGEFEQARAFFIQAVAQCAQIRHRPELALSRLALAELLLGHYPDERHEAIEHLDFAIGEFREMKMAPSIEKALRLKMGLQGILNIPAGTSIDRLTAAVEAEKPPITVHPAPDGTVTILFSDIEDSTVLTERLGDQAWLALLQRHNEIIRAQIKAHGGFEVKTIGDGFMVAFQSARRALECAIAMQRAMAAADWHTGIQASGHDEQTGKLANGQDAGKPTAESRQPLTVRIGLHAGEAIRDRDDFYGKNVILAARIGAQARGGQILVSALLKDLTQSSGRFRFDAGREVELKGLAGKHRMFEVEWQ